MSVASGFGTVGNQVRRQIDNDYDVKILITSHNSKPGLGKTTLAILMAHAWDRHGWSAKEKSFMNAHRFHNKYMDAPPGSVLLFDEIENEADNRRSNSNKNVQLTQMLATQRFRNVVSIFTLPAVSMVDSRMKELSDYWINVMKRGEAHPYKLYVNDYTGDVYESRIGQEKKGGDGEKIHWKDLPDDHRDKAYLDDMKREHSHLEREYVPQSEVEKKLEKAREEAQRELRDDALRTVYESSDLSHAELAEMDWVDVGRKRVSQVTSG